MADLNRFKKADMPGRLWDGIHSSIDLDDRKKIRYLIFVIPVFLILLAGCLLLCIPFFLSDNFVWSKMNLYFQGLMFCLTGVLVCHAYLSFRFGNTLLLLAVSFLVSYAAESAWIQWGDFFNCGYHYNPALVPMLPGEIPLFIPLSWFMLSYSALRFVCIIIMKPGKRLMHRHILLSALLCASYVVAIDLIIDPVATLYGTWFWHREGIYFGIPLGNFVNWFMISFGICYTYLILVKPFPIKYFRYQSVPDRTFMFATILLTVLFYIKCTIRIESLIPVCLALIIPGPLWMLAVNYKRHK